MESLSFNSSMPPAGAEADAMAAAGVFDRWGLTQADVIATMRALMDELEWETNPPTARRGCVSAPNCFAEAGPGTSDRRADLMTAA
jgi:hypothetical protein